MESEVALASKSQNKVSVEEEAMDSLVMGRGGGADTEEGSKC